MATYTVIQDIEAEDKLLGPLSLRQFIYVIIVFAIGFIAFMVAKLNILLAIPFLIPMGFFGLLAAPFGRDQSSEVWLLAKIRFMFKPRRRIWDQSGLKELVTITVPKQIERHLTDGLDQTQVKSRLSALASTLDSRGWAIKNVAANTFALPAYALSGNTGTSDRLVDAATIPQAVPNYDVAASDDILDEQNNPTAQKLDSLITQSEQARRQNLIATMRSGAPSTQTATNPLPSVLQTPAPPIPNPQLTPATVAATPVPAASPSSPEEQQLLEQIHKDKAAAQAATSHIKRVPTAEELAAAEAALAKTTARSEELNRLATNDDLNVATIARQAHKDTDAPQILDDGEVIISLH